VAALILASTLLLSSVGDSDADVPVEPEQVQAVVDVVEARLDCIAWFESRGDASARNPRSGAAGLFQFLPGTWAGTPQGRAGASVYDPLAARAAARWMLAQGRAREWTVVQNGLC
jgi:hypothetical protein